MWMDCTAEYSERNGWALALGLPTKSECELHDTGATRSQPRNALLVELLRFPLGFCDKTQFPECDDEDKT